MLEKLYTTKMSAERKQLQSRFTRIRYRSSKLSKIAASIMAAKNMFMNTSNQNENFQNQTRLFLQQMNNFQNQVINTTMQHINTTTMMVMDSMQTAMSMSMY